MEAPWDFEPLDFLDEAYDNHDILIGQYFEREYCPLLVSIDSMYNSTDMGTIDVPVTVKEMLEMEV